LASHEISGIDSGSGNSVNLASTHHQAYQASITAAAASPPPLRGAAPRRRAARAVLSRMCWRMRAAVAGCAFSWASASFSAAVAGACGAGGRHEHRA